jgi:hypothetical protein
MSKKDADSGSKNMSAVISGKNSLAEMNDDQLHALGGSRDPIDTEDFSEADFGNSVDPIEPKDEPEEDKGDEVKDDAGEETDDEPAKEEATDEDDKADEVKDDAVEETDDEPAKEEATDEDDEPAKDDDEETAEETDSEDEEEPTKDDEDEEDEDDEKKGQRVPLKRFRDVNKRMREAEKRVEALEAQIAAGKGKEPGPEEKAFDFDAAEDQYQDLVLDGKKAEARQLRNTIRAAEKAEFMKEATKVSSKTADASHDARVLDALAQDFENDFPEMDETSDSYNPEINQEVEALYIGYLNQGTPAPDAFAKAVTKAAKLFELVPLKNRPKPTKGGKGKPADKDKKVEPTEKQKVVAKKKADVKKVVAKKAPPDIGAAGKGGDQGAGAPKAIEDMTEEEFNALPKSKLARLRGDVL